MMRYGRGRSACGMRQERAWRYHRLSICDSRQMVYNLCIKDSVEGVVLRCIAVSLNLVAVISFPLLGGNLVSNYTVIAIITCMVQVNVI